ncbi:MAG: tRNA (adenosine(37)-N6)-threonylcarbamoyltransferase complex dimerization subunit type 1 TsaB [Hydrogenothermaceae bacterium]|nr:tRNA (adenosine(37)-N6)-threonylcarbamoyltransferase complex dimerization subunit type 1 TsaB [Hydrogenothermaceae bacterium]
MILSIDTFSDNFSVAVITPDKKVLSSVSSLKPKPFSEILIGKIDEVLKNGSVNKNQITAVVVNKGPGSNTGLRVGVITAKTIAYSLNIPIYAYESLDVMAYIYRYFCGKVVPAINIGKKRVAYKIFENDTLIQNLTVEELDNFISKFKDKDSHLIVEKNLNLNFSNSQTLLYPLSIPGAIYSLDKDLKADIMWLEPIYHD